MAMESDVTNPYKSPRLEQPPGRIVWTRLPYALLCAYRGYVAEMRRTGSRATHHLLVWFAVFLFGLVVTSFAMAVITELSR